MAEQWLEDHLGLIANNYISLMQVRGGERREGGEGGREGEGRGREGGEGVRAWL